jgi:hypothetical protein
MIPNYIIKLDGMSIRESLILGFEKPDLCVRKSKENDVVHVRSTYPPAVHASTSESSSITRITAEWSRSPHPWACMAPNSS